MDDVQVIVLVNGQTIISKIAAVVSELGEPDCKLTKPFILNSDGMLEPWLTKITRQDVLMMSSDKILTLVDPTPTLLEKYEDLIKE